MSPASWESYVKTLCKDVWGLDALTTEKLLTRIDALVAVGDVSDDSVARVLDRAGVSKSSARLLAPTIRVSIEV